MSTDTLLEQARQRRRQQERVVYQTGYAARSPTIIRSGLAVITPPSAPTSSASRASRYNNQRPNYQGQRVSIVEYPDPCAYGWTFTGSNEPSRVEFFEKQFPGDGALVKLDFYYTTGTVKTVLDHPRQGRTQLFGRGRDLSPHLYRDILFNPRAHTSVRYHEARQYNA